VASSIDGAGQSGGDPHVARYAASNESFVPVVDQHNGLGARRAPRRQQELAKGFAHRRYQGRALGRLFLARPLPLLPSDYAYARG